MIYAKPYIEHPLRYVPITRYTPITGVGVMEMSDSTKTMLGALGLAGSVAGVYHGYRRNQSVGWALVWGIMGAIVPFVTVPLSLAQGFGQRRGN